ncbi:MAG: PDZ domain-containing protein, partial [Planctomycetota bacterium]
HNIHDAVNYHAQKQGKFDISDMYRYPLPDTLGIHIDRHDGRAIETVAAGSPAAKAGLKAGDVITHVDGQPIISIADIQWVLDAKPKGDASVTLTVRRGGNAADYTVHMAAGWKKADFTWRGSMWAVRPRPGFWPPLLKDEEIKARGLDPSRKYMKVNWINQDLPEGQSAYKAGLRKGDVILAVNGKEVDWEPKELHVYMRTQMKPNDTLRLTILRGGQKKQIDYELTFK